MPLARYRDSSNGQPLMYAALASQKNHMAVYLMGVYGDEAERETFLEEYRSTGTRLDMGSSCVRFRRIEDLPVELLGRAIARYSVDDYIAATEEARSSG